MVDDTNIKIIHLELISQIILQKGNSVNLIKFPLKKFIRKDNGLYVPFCTFVDYSNTALTIDKITEFIFNHLRFN